MNLSEVPDKELDAALFMLKELFPGYGIILHVCTPKSIAGTSNLSPTAVMRVLEKQTERGVNPEPKWHLQ